jgi:hypothetical protein
VLAVDVLAGVGRKIRTLGFTRKGQTWRRAGESFIDVVNLQQSAHGGAPYLNVGIYLIDARNRMLEPYEHDCAIRDRISYDNRSVDEVLAAIAAWFSAQLQARGLRVEARPDAPVRVTHATFGSGVIVEDRGRTAKVAFSDGTVRMLAKSFLVVL